MKNGLFVLSLATALVAATAIIPASAKGRNNAIKAAAPRQHHLRHHPVRYARAGRLPAGQIACTVQGCHRIPPNCHPVTGYNFWGDATGYDDIACR